VTSASPLILNGLNPNSTPIFWKKIGGVDQTSPFRVLTVRPSFRRRNGGSAPASLEVNVGPAIC